MKTAEVMKELKQLGNENIKKIFLKHGAKEPFYGVKIEFLKKLQKKIKKDHVLSLELFETGNSDAMYLAGLIAEPHKMTKELLQKWMETANWHAIIEYPVAGVAAESDHGFELAGKWINSKNELVAAGGWATFSRSVSINPDENLNIKEIEKLLDKIEKEIHSAPNRVRYAMNGFVISVGCYIAPLTSKAKKIADSIGKVSVNMGETACKVPDAKAYIEKAEKAGKTGKKRKTAMC